MNDEECHIKKIFFSPFLVLITAAAKCDFIFQLVIVLVLHFTCVFSKYGIVCGIFFSKGQMSRPYNN